MKHPLSTYWLLGTVPNSRDRAMNKESPCSPGARAPTRAEQTIDPLIEKDQVVLSPLMENEAEQGKVV